MNHNKITTAILTIAMMLSVSYATARREKEVDPQKNAKKALNDKATKTARKSSKDYQKEGWLVTPGALPLEKQLDRAYMMQLEVDEDYLPRFIMSEAMSIGENYDGAKLQALELAKQNLAGQIETQMAAIIENSVSNSQLQANEAATITETISASKNLITQRLGRTVPVVELYRTLKNKNKEVLVRIAYNSDTALEVAKKVVREELSKRSDELHDQLDKAFDF